MTPNRQDNFIYGDLENNLRQYVKNHKLKTRPNASCGLWLFFVLPLSIILSTFKLVHVSYQYGCMTLFSGQLMVAGYAFMQSSNRRSIFTYKNFVLISGVLLICSLNNAGIPFNIVSGLLAFLFSKVYTSLMHNFPSCFSCGEAALFAQGLLMFLLSSGINIIHHFKHVPVTDSEISTLIIQIGLLGILLLCILVGKINFFKRVYPFYIVSGLVIGFGILLPMILILRKDAVLWIYNYIFNSQRRIYFILYCGFCMIIGAKALLYQIEQKKRANTSRRKVFHILAVMVYLPALLYECTFIYLASGVILGVFIFLEVIRILDIPPLGPILHDGFLIFVDEKDSAGGISLSPLYLLIGLSLPLWIHPFGCDLTDSAGFQLLPFCSGLLTIGVGDTFASIFGMLLGKHSWPGTKKTVEGTLGSILVQICCLYGLFHYDLIVERDIPKAILAIVFTSLVEAKTDQVDNLVLPLLAYIILV
ncbi:dolichol kinase [Chrysoperla carnea]|uniref:dolichol kinase n=1 Tax=Chrysoperla carnea TaxID=189513 RepID=UPI001D074BD6|nr:dolichol kinase [Chrysoperla carnea]